MTIFAAVPFMGPVLGPMVGGFILMTIGWCWVHGVCSIFLGVVQIAFSSLLPETVSSGPWVLLFLEPIMLISSTNLVILYGIIYMFLGAFTIVYYHIRWWNKGVGGLAFLGLAVGMIMGLIYTIIDNHRYARLGDQVTPESRRHRPYQVR
ncbi:hypothetical protein P885DRAFT_79176 [Corynascus similis CBS 632.67]